MVPTVSLNSHLIFRASSARVLYRSEARRHHFSSDALIRRVSALAHSDSSSSSDGLCKYRPDRVSFALHCVPSSRAVVLEFGGRNAPGTRTSPRSTGPGSEHVGRWEYIVKAYGWKVRRLIEDEVEMGAVARIQAQAFHEQVALFNDLFFQFFQAEVLAGLVYKLRNSAPDRYACLVAEPMRSDSAGMENEVVGVVDLTVMRENAVLQHLQEAEEYLYVSGIAVSEEFRRQKIATVLLQACEELSVRWGYDYLALRAYEDDYGARRLYANAGYRVVSGDPGWVSWIGKRRRVLMIKKSGHTDP